MPGTFANGRTMFGELPSGLLAPKSVTADMLADGAVTGRAFAPEAWTAYIPALSNVTIGNGTLIGRYTRIGRTVVATMTFIMGSTSAITGFAFWGLSLTASTAPPGGYVGAAYAFDSSAGTRFPGVVASNGSSVAAFVPQHITATVPFTWAVSDSLTWTITYEAAS